jgi:hypothetical protein
LLPLDFGERCWNGPMPVMHAAQPAPEPRSSSTQHIQAASRSNSILKDDRIVISFWLFRKILPVAFVECQYPAKAISRFLNELPAP